jgi:hypothetical protein
MDENNLNRDNFPFKIINEQALVDFINNTIDCKIKDDKELGQKKSDNDIHINYDKIKDIVNEVVNEKAIKKKQEEKENLDKHGSNLVSSNRIEKKDLMFFSTKSVKIDNNFYYSINGNNFNNYLFIRAIAKKIVFDSLDFSKCIFDSCYLRDCRFIRCNFEGAKFINCNLHGSYFNDCNFDYVIFEKTFVDDEIFQCAPKLNNLKYKFARSLKLNYASIGDYIKASNAVKVELEATKKHLYDTWTLNDDYHRNKYGGIRKRFSQFYKWLKVTLLDFLWGNGESLWRLVRFNLIIFGVLTVYDIFHNSIINALDIIELFLIKIPSNYFGLTVLEESSQKNYFEYYPNWLNLFLVISRLICLGLLMSIIIKKYNRR